MLYMSHDPKDHQICIGQLRCVHRQRAKSIHGVVDVNVSTSMSSYINDRDTKPLRHLGPAQVVRPEVTVALPPQPLRARNQSSSAGTGPCRITEAASLRG